MITVTSSAVAPVIDEQPDEALITRVLRGDTASFELLMRRYNERVYRAVRSIVRDEHEAEDMMQQAYVNAFTHLGQFNGSARFSTWLTRIAINEALARVRQHGRYEVFDEEFSNVEPFIARPSADNPEWQAFNRELRGLLESAIDALPNGMREVFALRDVEGLSTAEAATCLEVSRGRRQNAAVACTRHTAAPVVGSGQCHGTGRVPLLSSPLRSSRRPGAGEDSDPAAIRGLSPVRTRGSSPLPPAADSARTSGDDRSPT
jgi:RNA polymerase sigma-70 factor (ECF subfamily)